MANVDPYTTLRKDFSAALLSPTVPAGADPAYAKLFNNLHRLLELLAYDPAMAENNEQTYMTPAKSKNKVYFMWDFTGRSLGNLCALPPTLPKIPEIQEAFEDVQSRAALGASLITDKSGRLDAQCSMTEAQGQPYHRSYELTPETVEAARVLRAGV